MRTSSVLLVVMVLLAVSFSLQLTVSAQTTDITVYGQLQYNSCPPATVTLYLGPCQNSFSLATNGTTPGIPNYPTLDFSQSQVSAPSQSDVSKTIVATGYYGQLSSCVGVNPCYAFFVHTWGVLIGGSNANSLRTKLSYSWIAIAVVLVILLGYLFTHRKK